MTIRILTITSWYPPHHYGGYELSCYDVNTRFAARGHDVRVLCGDERMRTAAPADPEHERHVHRELRAHWREGSDWRPSLRETVAIERHNRRVLAHHLDEFRPDVVAMWHMVAISASLLRQCSDRAIPVVDVVCDDWPVYVEKFDPWTSRFAGNAVRNWTGRLVEAVTRMPTTAGNFTDTGVFCFVSEATRRRALDDRPWSFPISTVVFSGIERAHFPAARDAARAPWKWRLLYVGRLDTTKGVDTLLRAFAELPDEATLACYGRGADQERERLRAVAESLGIAARVTFGSLERDELAPTYTAADVVVFPSEWPEPFGLVPLEAMACGTPVVATGVGGSAEFLRDGYNCARFPAGDAPALAAAVRRLHDDPALRDRLVEGGAATAQQLDVDELAGALERWHVAAASRFRDGRPPDRTLALPPAPLAAPHGTGDRSPRATYERAGAPVIALYASPTRNDSPGARSVVARPEALPFGTHAFDTVHATALLERVDDDDAAAAELARVVRPGGVAVLETPNRDDLLVWWQRFRDRCAGLRTPPHAYLHAPAHRREYTVAELESRLAGFTITRAPRPVVWGNGPKRRAAAAAVRALRLRRVAQAFVIEARRT